MRTPRRIPLERLAGGEHQGDDGRRDKLLHRQRAADREDGDDIHARLAGQQVAEDRPGKADPHDPGRHGPGDRGQVVPTGPGEGQAQRQPAAQSGSNALPKIRRTRARRVAVIPRVYGDRWGPSRVRGPAPLGRSACAPPDAPVWRRIGSDRRARPSRPAFTGDPA